MRPYVGCFFLGGAPMTLRNLFEHDIDDIKKMIHDDPPPKKRDFCKLLEVQIRDNDYCEVDMFPSFQLFGFQHQASKSWLIFLVSWV